MRTFQMPILPGGWNETEKTFWRMLREALEALAKEITLNDLSTDVNDRFKNIDNGISTSDANIASLLERINSYVAIPIVDTLPLPTPDQRGKVMYQKGETTDGLYVCIMQSNILSWKRIDLYSPTPTPTPTPDPPPTPVEKYVYYNGTTQTNTQWSANYYSREDYTGCAHVNLDNDASTGYMQLYVEGYKGNKVSFNCHVATTEKIRVPANAATLKITFEGRIGTGSVCFGLLPDGAPKSNDDSAGGIMTDYTYFSIGTQSLSVQIPQDMRGSTGYRIVVNMRGSQSTTDTKRKEIRLSKVEFTT